MDFAGLKEALLDRADLAAIVDFRHDFQDFSPDPVPGHLQVCPSMATHTDNCDYIADGANLCALTHSVRWADFFACMYGYNLDADHANPLTSPETFDDGLGNCAALLSDYPAAELRTCAYGDEAGSLRKASQKRYADTGAKHTIWALVNGELVEGPKYSDDTTPRGPWARQVVAAVCASYAGPKPASCGSVLVV